MILHVTVGTLLVIPSGYLLAWGAYMITTGRGPKGRAARDWRNRPVPSVASRDERAWRLNGLGLMAGGALLLASALRAYVGG